MNLEFTPQPEKKKRAAKIATIETPASGDVPAKKERAPRKKKNMPASELPIIEESTSTKPTRKRSRSSPLETLPHLDLVPDAEREDMIREDFHIPEDLPLEGIVDPVNIDDLTFDDIVRTNHLEDKKFIETFGTPDRAKIVKILEQEVAAGNGTVETVALGDSGIIDTFDHPPKHNPEMATVPQEKPVQKTTSIRHWPPVAHHPNSPEKKPGLFERMRNWLMPDDEELDED